MEWSVYILVSEQTGRTYVGVTTDLKRRLRQHNGEIPGGAQTTRAHRPWRVAKEHGPFTDRGEAQKLEYTLKRRRGKKRLEGV